MDEPRLLHRRSEMGYTKSPAIALRGEPEAVPEEYEQLLVARSADLELRTWQTSKQRMLAEIEHLRAQLHSPHVPRTARAIEREIAALDRKLTAE